MLPGPSGLPVVKRVTVGDRLLSRLRARAIDHALAAGRGPRNAAAALRARRLTSMRSRRKLAQALAGAIAEARDPSPLSRAPIVRPRVLEAAVELSQLAELLLRPGPVSAGGMARVQLLLTEGVGPLYNPSCRDDLAWTAALALDALRV